MRLAAGILAAALFATSVPAAVDEGTTIIPLVSGIQPGAFGGAWEVHSILWNSGPRTFVTFASCRLAECGAPIASGETVLGNPGGSFVDEPVIAILPEGHRIATSISLRNLAHPDTSEVRIPVARLQEMSQDSLLLLNVPVSGESREHIRIYLIDETGDPGPDVRTVKVAVFDAASGPDAAPLLTISREVPMTRGNILISGHATLLDIDVQLDNLGVERVRIELSEDTDSYLWGFVTSTENIQNQPLVIAPE